MAREHRNELRCNTHGNFHFVFRVARMNVQSVDGNLAVAALKFSNSNSPI